MDKLLKTLPEEFKDIYKELQKHFAVSDYEERLIFKTVRYLSVEFIYTLGSFSFRLHIRVKKGEKSYIVKERALYMYFQEDWKLWKEKKKSNSPYLKTYFPLFIAGDPEEMSLVYKEGIIKLLHMLALGGLFQQTL